MPSMEMPVCKCGRLLIVTPKGNTMCPTEDFAIPGASSPIFLDATIIDDPFATKATGQTMYHHLHNQGHVKNVKGWYTA